MNSNKAFGILVLWLFSAVLSGHLHAQKPDTRFTFPPYASTSMYAMADSIFTASLKKGNLVPLTTGSSWQSLRPLPVAPNQSMRQWGWYCRAEYKFQQTTKLPLYLRLGSKEQTDMLEGKLK